MSQEITVTGSLSVTKPTPAAVNSVIFDSTPSSITPTQNGSHAVKATQSIGTSDETLPLGDIATIGWVFFRNLDLTNYITFGPDGSVYSIKLKAGEFGVFRWNGAAIHAKANTAPCVLEYLILED